MAKRYIETYYDIEESEMQDLVVRAKNFDGVAQMQLLDIFKNFLSKYTTLLYYGKYTLKGPAGYDNRRFLALFVKDPLVRFYLIRDKLNLAGMKQLNEVVRGIQYMVQRYGDEEDVEQTVKMAFFECVNIYTPKESKDGPIPFSAFLYSYFFYKLKKQVDVLLIDQLGRKTFPLIGDEEANTDEWSSEEKVQGFTAPPTPAAEELIQCEEIDEYWVAGDTATGPFAKLTVQERQLLRWRYVDGERSSDIAQRITEHSNTVRVHFIKIKQRIQEYIEEDLG